MDYSIARDWIKERRQEGYGRGVLVANWVQESVEARVKLPDDNFVCHSWDEDYHIWFFLHEEDRDEFVKGLRPTQWVDDPGPAGKVESYSEEK